MGAQTLKATSEHAFKSKIENFGIYELLWDNIWDIWDNYVLHNCTFFGAIMKHIIIQNSVEKPVH